MEVTERGKVVEMLLMESGNVTLMELIGLAGERLMLLLVQFPADIWVY